MSSISFYLCGSDEAHPPTPSTWPARARAMDGEARRPCATASAAVVSTVDQAQGTRGMGRHRIVFSSGTCVILLGMVGPGGVDNRQKAGYRRLRFCVEWQNCFSVSLFGEAVSQVGVWQLSTIT